MFRSYVKIAWRALMKDKVNTVISISGFALGITACLIVFVISNHELSYDNFHQKRSNIYRIVGSLDVNGQRSNYGFVPSPLPTFLKIQITDYETIAGFFNYNASVGIPSEGTTSRKFDKTKNNIPSSIIITDPDYFNIFEYEWLAGDKKTALKDPFKVVLTDAEAVRYFGVNSWDRVVGKEIFYNDSLHVTVSGIVKSWTKNSDLNFGDFISSSTISHSFLKNEINLEDWGTWDYNSQAYIKLSKNISPEQITRQFPRFIAANFKDDAPHVELKMQPLADIHFNNLYQDAYSRKADRSTVYGLMGIALIILIVASINYINLSAAQSITRAKEIGMRKVLGSSKIMIAMQFLIQTSLVSLSAIVISILLCNPLIKIFSSFFPPDLKLQLFQPITWVFFLGIFLLVSFLAGLYPAKLMASGKTVISLKGTGFSNVKFKNHLSKGLIVFQFAISLIFIFETIVVSKQIKYMVNKDIGFDRYGIININVNDEKISYISKRLLANKLQQLPQITEVSLNRQSPAAKRHGGTTLKLVSSDHAEINASFEFGDDNYLKLFGIKLLAGRNISYSDSIKEFVINEVCANALGFQHPNEAVGQIVEVGIGGKKGPIVGIINNFNNQSLHESVKPFFLTSSAEGVNSVSIKLALNSAGSLPIGNTLLQLGEIWKNMYPDIKFEYEFLDQTIASFYEAEQRTSQLVNLAMFISIFISCIGLYGVSSFIIKQRNKEVSVRKVLGASGIDIVLMLFSEFLRPVSIGILIAFPIAWVLTHKWLNNFSFRVDITWKIFALSGAFALVMAIFAVVFHALRAAIAKPIANIRAN